MVEFDVKRARRETPGCEHVIHFNNAGAGLLPEPVLSSMIDYLQLEAQIGGYEAAAASAESKERTYTAAAEIINASPDEIAVMENATVAWSMAFLAIPFQVGDRILTSHASYASNYLTLMQTAERTGAVIEVVPHDDWGQIDVQALGEMMDERVKLIELTHVPTNGGLVNPAVEVGQIARKWNCFYLLDACQSVGQMPIDVQKIGCDMLSTTGRKWLRGPRGTGFLYVNKDRVIDLIPPFIDLHSADWTAVDRYEIRSDARRFENWEFNYAAHIGLGKAIDYALSWGIEAIWERVKMLANDLRTGLNDIPGITTRDLGQIMSGTVTFTVEGCSAAEVQKRLAAHKINVSIATINSTRLDMEDRGLAELVRASVHYFNTTEEIQKVIDVLS